jgi:hypothetical protein
MVFAEWLDYRVLGLANIWIFTAGQFPSTEFRNSNSLPSYLIFAVEELDISESNEHSKLLLDLGQNIFLIINIMLSRTT